MSSIAALIITYNEEKNIRECLESINWCDEIVKLIKKVDGERFGR